jgi:hypothetical protein
MRNALLIAARILLVCLQWNERANTKCLAAEGRGQHNLQQKKTEKKINE